MDASGLILNLVQKGEIQNKDFFLRIWFSSLLPQFLLTYENTIRHNTYIICFQMTAITTFHDFFFYLIQLDKWLLIL